MWQWMKGSLFGNSVPDSLDFTCTWNGSNFRFSLAGNATMGDLKDKLYRHTKVPRRHQKFIGLIPEGTTFPGNTTKLHTIKFSRTFELRGDTESSLKIRAKAEEKKRMMQPKHQIPAAVKRLQAVEETEQEVSDQLSIFANEESPAVEEVNIANKKILCMTEELMKVLLVLDSIQVPDGDWRTRRKALVKRTQGLIEKFDKHKKICEQYLQ
eukprot:TRINITY_DN6835_c0_g2_i1.p2 TRINITY_DN6835_c0_g2~~TRINITY_DN6835_c0_g2_i1.p2  ORF type:complete len:211 (-),score=37.01 TRINITY_DN6835_c0_g2_i1:983-1615(-)